MRVSGPDAHAISRKIINPWPETPRHATLCTISSNSSEIIDQAVVITYSAPSSFTGEDMVEISTHGGLITPTRVLAALIAAGCREALPGEFTRRAVLNGKLDLVQAEAIGDLIDARSTAQQTAALKQLDGGLSRRIAQLREQVLELEALIAYDIDFPEEDDGPIDSSRITAKAAALSKSLKDLLDTAPRGEIVREGAMVVIAGPPNAGKSSLFNALVGQARAIVTEIPGTTRDAIEAVVDGQNWPLRLVDTAGLRDTTDVVERLGIETSERYLKDAHVVLACGDNEEALSLSESVCQSLTGAPILPVLTKADLAPIRSQSTPVSVSAETGQGLRQLLDAIDQVITQHYGGNVSPDQPILTRTRHKSAITSALTESQLFEKAWQEDKLPPTVAAVHLRASATHLEELIGAVGVEEVLGRVFSSFCVGK